MVHVALQLTTFEGITFAEMFGERAAQYQERYMPIHPSPGHPPYEKPLQLENHMMLEEAFYVNLDEYICVKLLDLDLYRGEPADTYELIWEHHQSLRKAHLERQKPILNKKGVAPCRPAFTDPVAAEDETSEPIAGADETPESVAAGREMPDLVASEDETPEPAAREDETPEPVTGEDEIPVSVADENETYNQAAGGDEKQLPPRMCSHVYFVNHQRMPAGSERLLGHCLTYFNEYGDFFCEPCGL
ncbi:hypothetical protein QBC47DRAFT_403970 [Echria macrotheca]|uniref:Uncharacterized protein n=1 Tax=Echria macrotheca TaxID=438768 RepID=A0AAJ0F3M1_9PEZI|nr:hypothetical protein QBC47DRAFT_403970 [Echria macrotheca]